MDEHASAPLVNRRRPAHIAGSQRRPSPARSTRPGEAKWLATTVESPSAAGPGAPAGRERDVRLGIPRSVPLEVLDLERVMDDVDHVNQGVADLQDRVSGAVAGGRAQAQTGFRLVPVVVALEEPAAVERRDDAGGRAVVARITSRLVDRSRRPDHGHAGESRPQLVGPVLDHEAAGVVEVEMRDDDEVRLRILGLESSPELVGRSGPDGDEGPRAASTRTVRPWPRRSKTLTGVGRTPERTPFGARSEPSTGSIPASMTKPSGHSGEGQASADYTPGRVRACSIVSRRPASVRRARSSDESAARARSTSLAPASRL